MFNEYKLNDKITLRNRVVMAPMTTWAGNSDLTVADDEAKYYAERSKEVGMVVTGCTFFEKNGQGFENEFFAGSDEFIPSLKKLADSIKAGGAKAVLQIFHAGRMGDASKHELVSASAVKPNHTLMGPVDGMPEPRAMTNDEILKFIDGFYQTVRRAVEAGFDGVEIHGANTYLIQQFFSPHSNRRDDMWGGSLENRMRLPLEIIKATNKAKKDFANDDFIVGYRFSPEEAEVPGISLDDTLVLVDKLSEEELDYLSVSLGHYKASSMKNNNIMIGKVLVEKIAGRKPLIGVGQVKTKENAQEAINEVGYDLIAVGHALVTDAKWLSKVQNGETPESAVIMSEIEKQVIPAKMAGAINSMSGWFEVK
ncbi:MAG: NADH-dependent flavin oxidoreductase [Sarcina sp.]